MPKLLHARAPVDETEQRLVRKLATSRHAPVDWVWHAKMIVRSWDGARTSTIAAEVGSHPQTVRERHRRRSMSARSQTGWGSSPGGGRRPRLVEAQRSVIIALRAHDSRRQTRSRARQRRIAGADEQGAGGVDARCVGGGGAPVPRASRWRAVRCGAFSAPKACAGDGRGCGRRAKIRTSPQKDADRHPLHGSAGGSDGSSASTSLAP